MPTKPKKGKWVKRFVVQVNYNYGNEKKDWRDSPGWKPFKTKQEGLLVLKRTYNNKDFHLIERWERVVSAK
ncbi:MAG: hypothetical protein WC497_05490 [Patescibacteria group bacterium]